MRSPLSGATVTRSANEGGIIIRKSISTRIVISYICIIVSALLVVGVVFSLLARYYTERQTKAQLLRDAAVISEMVEKEASTNKNIAKAAESLLLRKKVFSLAGTMDSSLALVSRDLKILYPKTGEDEQFRRQILPKIKDKLVGTKIPVSIKVNLESQEYLLAIFPPKSDISQDLKCWVILYDPVGPIQKIISSLLFVLAVSLLITAFIAVFAGTFIARTIAKPIIQLKDRAEAVSKRIFDGTVDIHTGDELEELGRTIDNMAYELKEYDITQKRFFQNASHELKTPLMSIQGYAEGIKDGVFESNDEALDVIVEESKRLKSIVDELIFLSKIETQEDFYKFSAESMNNLIEKSVTKLKGLSIKDNISISLILYKDALISVDQDKMTQALVNIMGNCVRYARSEVNIVTANDGRFFEIRIRDNGDGFDENESKKVFERFYKGKKGGSGLGLAITKAIVEKHNGTIDAGNAPGGGAEFRIRIPIA